MSNDSFLMLQWWVQPPANSSVRLDSAGRASDKHHHLLEPTRAALQAHAKAWCAQSSCCSAYHARTFVTSDALPGNWAKVIVVRELLRKRMRPVLLLDVDAFIQLPRWCPVWPSDEIAMMVAPDPQPWRNPVNSGFFLIRPIPAGFAILESWWAAFLSPNVSDCWATGGECAPCVRDRSTCRFPCTNGGRCADQGGLNGKVLPMHRRHIQVLPRGFQDASLRCTGEAHCQQVDGRATKCVVKHFAGGFNRPRALGVLERCGGGLQGAGFLSQGTRNMEIRRLPS